MCSISWAALNFCFEGAKPLVLVAIRLFFYELSFKNGSANRWSNLFSEAARCVATDGRSKSRSLVPVDSWIGQELLDHLPFLMNSLLAEHLLDYVSFCFILRESTITNFTQSHNFLFHHFKT